MAIIPSNTQFRGDTTGVPIVEKGSAQTQARAGIFTMADIAQSVAPDPDADVYSNKLFTNIANVSANITSFSETSSTVVTSYSITQLDAYFGNIQLLATVYPFLLLETNLQFSQMALLLLLLY